MNERIDIFIENRDFMFTYAEFTLYDFGPDFHSPTGFVKSPTNVRNRRQIGPRSRE